MSTTLPRIIKWNQGHNSDHSGLDSNQSLQHIPLRPRKSYSVAEFLNYHYRFFTNKKIKFFSHKPPASIAENRPYFPMVLPRGNKQSVCLLTKVNDTKERPPVRNTTDPVRRWKCVFVVRCKKKQPVKYKRQLQGFALQIARWCSDTKRPMLVHYGQLGGQKRNKMHWWTLKIAKYRFVRLNSPPK